MHPARIEQVAQVGEYLGFPVLRFSVIFDEDGEVGQTEVVAGRSALALKPGDAVQAWTDDEGVLAGVVHPGWPSTLDDAFARLAHHLGVHFHRHGDDAHELGAELGEHDVVAVLTDQWMVYLGVETPFDAIDDDFELDLRHLFDPEDRLPTEVTVRGELVADLETAGEAASLPATLPEAVLDRIEAMAERLDGPFVIDREGVSVVFTATLFDGDLWFAVLRELLALWAEIDAATRNPSLPLR